ncbi:MAG: hypothetical protein M3Z96_12860 [Pseudomonadota bacterium]|nr:hypothetical protein [Pseudomonadota bacterium]
MSEVSSGALSVAFKFIDKFISDYGIWLWLLTFLLILIVANKIGFVALDSFGHRNVDIVLIGALFVFCMLMNALSAHVHILSFFRSIVAGIEGAMVSRFRLKEAKRNFQQIMKTDCRERDWLVWYIFVYEKNNRYRPYKLFNKVIEGRTITYGDYYGYKWNDDIAHWLLGCYYIFYTIPESDIFYQVYIVK